jgi:hypothetical protein
MNWKSQWTFFPGNQTTNRGDEEANYIWKWACIFYETIRFYDMIDSWYDTKSATTTNDQNTFSSMFFPLNCISIRYKKGNRTVMIRIRIIRFTFGSSFGQSNVIQAVSLIAICMNLHIAHHTASLQSYQSWLRWKSDYDCDWLDRPGRSRSIVTSSNNLIIYIQLINQLTLLLHYT